MGCSHLYPRLTLCCAVEIKCTFYLLKCGVYQIRYDETGQTNIKGKGHWSNLLVTIHIPFILPQKWTDTQTDTQTDRQTHIWTNQLIESIAPEGQCFENINNYIIYKPSKCCYKSSFILGLKVSRLTLWKLEWRRGCFRSKDAFIKE